MDDAEAKTGEVCGQSSVYRASCGCGHEARILRGNPFPVCMICGRKVGWTTNRPGKQPDSDRKEKDHPQAQR